MNHVGGKDSTRRLANEVRLACQLVSHKVRFESGSKLAPHQLGLMWNLLQGPKTPGELAEKEQVSAPSITKTLDGLEELGFVERSKDPDDGRRRNIALTQAGRAELRSTASIRDSFMEERLRSLTAEERSVLQQAASILQRVIV